MSSCIADKPVSTHHGYVAVSLIIAAIAIAIGMLAYQIHIWQSSGTFSFLPLLVSALLIGVAVLIGFGVFIIQPN